MPRHQGLYFQQWWNCGRCGFVYPIGHLVMQKGLLVCPKDIDNLDVEYRPKLIAEALADTQETTNEFEHVQEDPGTIEF
jgi:hypothetical protein